MQGQLYMPDGRFRSSTAVAGKADVRDENLFSAIVLAHGGQGQQTIFTNPRGQPIPALKGSAITVAQAHQTTYTEVTTVMTKAGEFGSGIGDVSIRAIGATLEVAPQNPTDNSISAWGATLLEAADVASKVFLQFKIAGKKQIEGPIWSFPAAGGVYGANVMTAGSLVANGPNALPRKLKLPILVARNDTVECVVGVAGAASLVFRTTTGAGAASLLTVMLHSLVKGDVR